VVVTGQDDTKTMQKAFAAGTTFFLQKPIDRQRLTNLFKGAPGKIFENRRHFVRVPLQTEVICQVGDQTLRGTSSNISQGGILFSRVTRVSSATARQL
jgi:DNA-binding NtrC family response regulator